MKIDIEQLEYWMSLHEDDIFSDMEPFVKGAEHTRRIFIDNDSDILLVAHLDTVRGAAITKVKGNKVIGKGFDDRLGCYIAYELSERLGCDLLLTDLEETGMSTAQYHDLKEYNWIAEFDRAGDDVVTYNMDNARFRKLLARYFKIESGLFSDLCFMETDCCSVNVGIGYKYAHSDTSCFDIKVAERQIDKFILFYEKYKDEKFVIDNPLKENYRYDGKPYLSNYYSATEICVVCGGGCWDEVHGYGLCLQCADELFGEKDHCVYCGEPHPIAQMIRVNGVGLVCDTCYEYMGHFEASHWYGKDRHSTETEVIPF